MRILSSFQATLRDFSGEKDLGVISFQHLQDINYRLKFVKKSRQETAW